MSLLLNIAKCTKGALTEATVFRSYHKLIKCSFRILSNLQPQKIQKLGNIQLEIHIPYISYFKLPLFGCLVAIVDGKMKRKQPEQILCFWFQALWYLAAALIEPLKFLSAHAGSAGWLTKHFFLRQKLCLFSLPLCESVTLCRSFEAYVWWIDGELVWVVENVALRREHNCWIEM